jgi:hypothetical protein
MREDGAWVPAALVLAAFWSFGLAIWRPQWMNQSWQTRLLTVFAEALICLLIWISVQRMINTESLGAIVAGGLQTGFAWAVSRYKSILEKQRAID